MASRTTSATINRILTNYAQGLSNDLLMANAIVNALMPTIQVNGATGGYKKFDDRNSFANYTTARGLGGSAKRIEFSATDGTFSCEPQALEVTIDDHERELAGGPGDQLAMQLLDEGKVRALINVTAVSHVKKVVDYVISKLTAVNARGNWSNDAIDPIDQLDEQLEALVTDVGSSQNINLVLSLTAWRTLRQNAKIKARSTGVSKQFSRQDLIDALMVPVNLIIGAVSYTGTKPGQSTVSKSQILGAYAFLSYAVPNPTVHDPSAFKMFTTGAGNIEAVRTYRDEGARSDVHAVDWSEDPQQTSTLAAKMLAIT